MTPEALPPLLPLQLALWWLASFYGVASVACFIAYALDKSAAVEGRGRISERSLLLIGLACGWPGGLVAQRWLRHKTSKTSFQLAFWCSVVLNISLVWWLCTLY